MKTYFFLLMCLFVLSYLLMRRRSGPSANFRSVDAIVPAYNEEPILEASLRSMMMNPYINRVICVNDGSTDGTAAVMAKMVKELGPRLIAVNQANSGKGGALMNGLNYATAKYVFLTDADTRVPYDKNGIGYMLTEMDLGADAVGGIPSSDLNGAGLLPHIRATVKWPMITIKRTFQQIVGGAPFIISGACGLFKVDVLKKFGFSDRTKVEDLDLTWTLVAEGYKVRQANQCVVYPQECNTVKEEWRRWRRWIVGYAVCMRLHKNILLTRFGLVSVLPMFALVAFGVVTYATSWATIVVEKGPHALTFALFPLVWVGIVFGVGLISAAHHRKLWLAPLAPLAVIYVLLAYTIWTVHGLKGLVTGREPKRDKPTRYTHVVE